jgi:hypothetical protein
MHQCLKCNKEFKIKRDLERHLNRKIKCDNQIECEFCQKIFKTKQLLQQHMNKKKNCRLEAAEYRNEVLELKNQNLELKLEIEKLKNTNNTTNITNNINNTNNGTINNTINIFGNEDLTHITKKILKEEILKIAEADLDPYKGKLFEIKGQRYNNSYIRDMELHMLLNKFIYFSKKKNRTIKKENDKFYINKEEGWTEINQEDLYIITLFKQQELLAKNKDLTVDDKLYRRVVEKYFTDDECNVIIEATGVKDKMINKKPRKQILYSLLDYELENVKKNFKLNHELNLIK